jgi:predicted O-linked N-acetylglucosamine transferase (SPINDLY family)
MSTRRGNILKLASTQGRYQPKSISDRFGQLITEAENLQRQGKTEQAIAMYQSFIESGTHGLTHAALFNLGVLLSQSGQPASAIEAYREAIRISPDFLEPRINLGSVLEQQGNVEEALALWLGVPDVDKAAVPNAHRQAMHTQALNNAGRLLESKHDFPAAEAALRRSLAINPHQPDVIQHWVHLRQKQCIWPVFEALPGLSTAEMLLSVSPLAMLAHTDDPSLQLIAAQNFVRRKLQVPQAALAAGKNYQHQRLRIGYLSGDLCVHAVGLLLAEVIAQHDRNCFEITAFDFSHDDGSAYQTRLRSAFDHRHDIRRLSDSQAARLIADCEIDVLLDLQGLSSGTRPGILAQRPAPVQVSWLGFIGSSAMPWIDYVIGDRFSLTEDMQPFFTEKFLHMASSFLPRDPKREQGARTERSLLGLPDDKVVLASFNNAYKLNAEMFAAWMRILQRAPNTVLWLLDDNPTATANLRRTAAEAGIGSDRLIFTQRIGYADFISRLQLADLFLDNHPYNAGSTAHDALHAGLPVLTMSGKSFVSRMAGSLLSHAGLHELVTFNLSDYIDKAVELSNDPARLAVLRERVMHCSQDHQSVSEQVRALESVLLQAAGKAPHTKAVTRAAVEQAVTAAQSRSASPWQLLAEHHRASIYLLSNTDNAPLMFESAARASIIADPAWQHFHRVRDFFHVNAQSSSVDEDRLYGFFPDNFVSLTGMDTHQIVEKIDHLSLKTAVAGIVLPADAHAFFLNVFEQVEVFDPGFTEISEHFFAIAGLPVPLQSLVMDARQSVVTPFLLARPVFWRQWVALAEQLYALMQSSEITSTDDIAGLRRQLELMGGEAAQRSRATLLLERLAAVLLVLDSTLCAQTISLISNVNLQSDPYSLANAAVVSNALKLAIRETGQAEYSAAFAAQRDHLLQTRQVMTHS